MSTAGQRRIMPAGSVNAAIRGSEAGSGGGGRAEPDPRRPRGTGRADPGDRYHRTRPGGALDGGQRVRRLDPVPARPGDHVAGDDPGRRGAGPHSTPSTRAPAGAGAMAAGTVTSAWAGTHS